MKSCFNKVCSLHILSARKCVCWNLANHLHKVFGLFPNCQGINDVLQWDLTLLDCNYFYKRFYAIFDGALGIIIINKTKLPLPNIWAKYSNSWLTKVSDFQWRFRPFVQVGEVCCVVLFCLCLWQVNGVAGKKQLLWGGDSTSLL